MPRVRIETVCTAADDDGILTLDLSEGACAALLDAFENPKKRSFCLEHKGDRIFLNLSQVVSMVVFPTQKAKG